MVKKIVPTERKNIKTCTNDETRTTKRSSIIVVFNAPGPKMGLTSRACYRFKVLREKKKIVHFAV